jgi:uncharacterized protein
MPAQVSYPGVYVEEIPSGVRTITGVATSITAFIGAAAKGPVNRPVTINNYGDYERKFGGLVLSSTMSYAVRDFYLNGGSQAIIVRLASNDAAHASVSLDTDDADLVIQANSPGKWGNQLAVAIDHEIADPTAAPSSPPSAGRFFNLTIFQKDSEGQYLIAEEHLKVSLHDTDTRYLPKVLQQNSTLVEVPETSPGSGTWSVNQAFPDTTAVTPPTSPPSPLDGALIPEPLTSGDDGSQLTAAEYQGSRLDQTGLYAFLQVDLFNLLCIPPVTRTGDMENSVYQQALTLCNDKRAILIVDPPMSWGTIASQAAERAKNGLGGLGLTGSAARNAAIYFPRVQQPDPLKDNQMDTFVPCGIIAGAIARNDTARGVWKSPAGIDVGLNGISGLQVNLSNPENGMLNPLGINCLRNLRGIGRVIWGARTIRGANILADEYKYLAVRRTLLFLQESLDRGLQWVVFEPNDEPLWAQIRLNVGAFMHGLYRQGAFQGKKKDAYFVKCDSETTTPTDINSGIVNIVVGFAPLKPAEFVIIKFQQMAGQIAS